MGTPGGPPLVTHRSSLITLVRRVAGLHLFRGVLEDDIGRGHVALLRALAADDGNAEAGDALELHSRIFSLLAAETELSSTPLVGDAWQNHLLDRLLCDENPFSRKAERAPMETMGSSLLAAARGDLGVLRDLFLLDGAALHMLLSSRLSERAEGLVPWSDLAPLASSDAAADAQVPPLKGLLAAEPEWAGLLAELANHYASHGAGDFARYRAFRWVRDDRDGRLEGIAHPDGIRLEELVEYDVERRLLLQNTEQFVAGFPANNVLLYGDRGTGKSSTVKSLLHCFGDRGLRLVEVPKSLLGDFPRILARIRGRRERFVLFVDDLSFGEPETSYKELKAALEGGVEARPENVVVYATSNRRHLVQENFSDRTDGNGDIRRYDTYEEKLSLGDRFGITLVFSTPDKARYLRIVESLAEQRGLKLSTATLHARAVEWAAQQGGFSGRTARQLVDHLTGEMGLAGVAAQERA